ASSESRMCSQCGKTQSAEWRRGPEGKGTLCNACGLRWAKECRLKDLTSSSGEASQGLSSAGKGKRTRQV
ncbi:hypothetical protein BJ684DRAFT_18672, partial [Piptocephalis cylindrospora]